MLNFEVLLFRSDAVQVLLAYLLLHNQIVDLIRQSAGQRINVDYISCSFGICAIKPIKNIQP